MKLTLRSKLFAALLGMIVVSVLGNHFYLEPAMERDLLDRIQDDLVVRLALVSRAAEGIGDLDRGHWDALADDLGPLAQGRVTFIDPTGQVLGDSEVAFADLPALENHRDRPEVAAALAGHAHWSSRYSTTVRRRLMYAATPLALPGGGHGAARLAVPLDRVDAAISHLRHILWGAVAVALLVAFALSTAVSRVFSRTLRGMTDAARRMAGGELDLRMRIGGNDEIADLGRALDVLAANLASTLSSLRSERDLLGVILESMQEGVLVLDQDGRMLLVNPALQSTLRLPPHAEGRAALELIRNAELQAVLERALSARGPATGEIETTGPKPRRLLVHAAPLPADPGEQPRDPKSARTLVDGGREARDGRSRGLLAVFVDVTEIRRLETLRKDFVANVSHELRTPITAVRSAVDTLRLTLASDPGASERFVEIIDRNAQRLGALVEDLLDLSRIESKEYRPESKPISLRAVSEQVVTLLRARIEQKSMALVNEIPVDLPAARADRRALEQVFTNLLDNAVKYCGAGARVRLSAERQENQIRVEIADTGPGIEQRHLARLFERFYRVDSGRSRDMGGTGLGLSIVKHLVEAMGGAIGVESIPGKGSTFWFLLPLAER